MYHIHCIEENASRLHLIFGCGMELLRKGEQKGDIYSCMFNADGRCFYKTASEPRDWSGKYTQEKLCRIVDAAVKRAELRNLNKEEQKLVSAAPQAETKNLFWLLIPISGLLPLGLSFCLCRCSVFCSDCLRVTSKRCSQSWRRCPGCGYSWDCGWRFLHFLSFHRIADIVCKEEIAPRGTYDSGREVFPAGILCPRRKATAFAPGLCHNGRKGGFS